MVLCLILTAMDGGGGSCAVEGGGGEAGRRRSLTDKDDFGKIHQQFKHKSFLSYHQFGILCLMRIAYS